MSGFYRPPVDPGYGQFARNIMGGIGSGFAMYREGQARQEEQRRREMLEQQAAQQERLALADRKRRMAMEDRRTALEDAELGIIPEAEAFEPTPAGPPGGDAIFDALYGAEAPRMRFEAARTAPEPRLRQGVRRVGDLYINPEQGLAAERERGREVARRALEQAAALQEEKDRRQRVDEVTEMLVAAGRPRNLARQEAISSAYDVSLTPPKSTGGGRSIYEDIERRRALDAEDERQKELRLARITDMLIASGRSPEVARIEAMNTVYGLKPMSQEDQMVMEGRLRRNRTTTDSTTTGTTPERPSRLPTVRANPPRNRTRPAQQPQTERDAPPTEGINPDTAGPSTIERRAREIRAIRRGITAAELRRQLRREGYDVR